jgi:hypothetical protein
MIEPNIETARWHETINWWDDTVAEELRGFGERLDRRGKKLEVTVQRHQFGSEAGSPSVDVSENMRPFRGGEVHVIVGSPLASDVCEIAVPALHGLASYTPDLYTEFSHYLAWHRPCRPSSFGRTWERDYDAVVNRAGKIVARHVPKTNGTGPDAGLIVVSRVSTMGSAAAQSSEGLVVVVCGITGLSTLACARVFMDAANARELYPEAVDKPLMRAVTVTCSRPEAGGMRDQRVLQAGSWRLVTKEEEAQATETAPCTPRRSQAQFRPREALVE